MSRILLGVICGLVFGAIDIAIMLTMSFPDKKAANHCGVYCAVWDWIRHRRDPLAFSRMDGGALLSFAIEHPRCHHHKSLWADYRYGSTGRNHSSG